MPFDAVKVYEIFKGGSGKYKEEYHCPLLLKLMAKKGRISAFCKEAVMSERKFYQWVNKYPLFGEVYEFGKILAREAWEDHGETIRDKEAIPGVIDNEFEYWKMIGWSRFGISKNSRIKLNLNPKDSPDKHYSQLLTQAANGDFTAAEIKQLMEAVNVGLSTHQVFELQKQIDGLKEDLVLMTENANAHNSISDKRVKKKN